MISFEIEGEEEEEEEEKIQSQIVHSYDHLVESLYSMFYDRTDRIVIISIVLIRHHHVHPISNRR